MRPKFAKTKPRQLTINVQSFSQNTIKYYLLHDHKGELYEFVVPYDNPVDLSMIKPTGCYQVNSKVNHRGSYMWTDVKVLKRPDVVPIRSARDQMIDSVFSF